MSGRRLGQGKDATQLEYGVRCLTYSISRCKQAHALRLGGYGRRISTELRSAMEETFKNLLLGAAQDAN